MNDIIKLQREIETQEKKLAFLQRKQREEEIRVFGGQRIEHLKTRLEELKEERENFSAKTESQNKQIKALKGEIGKRDRKIRELESTILDLVSSQAEKA